MQPPDLTTLRQRNNNEFPFYRIFLMVDGRGLDGPHGTRSMPAWGRIYSEEAGDRFGPYGSETFIRGRIVDLVRHVESLQK